MSQAEDLILVGQVTLLGSRRAFDTLVRKYQGDVRRLLLNLTGGDADLAADIAQDTFLKAWLYIGSYKGKSRFRTWLFSIAYNVFYDYAASRRQHAHSDLSECEYHLTDDDGRQVERNIDLYRALESLRPAERTAVVLFTSSSRSSRTLPGSWACRYRRSRPMFRADGRIWQNC